MGLSGLPACFPRSYTGQGFISTQPRITPYKCAYGVKGTAPPPWVRPDQGTAWASSNQPPGEGSCSGRGHTRWCCPGTGTAPARLPELAGLSLTLNLRPQLYKKSKLCLTRKAADPFTSTPSTPDTFLRDPGGGKASQVAPAGSKASPRFFISGQGGSGDHTGCISQHITPLRDTPET